jgi:hypothetical protein
MGATCEAIRSRPGVVCWSLCSERPDFCSSRGGLPRMDFTPIESRSGAVTKGWSPRIPRRPISRTAPLKWLKVPLFSNRLYNLYSPPRSDPCRPDIQPSTLLPMITLLHTLSSTPFADSRMPWRIYSASVSLRQRALPETRSIALRPRTRTAPKNR